MADIDIETTISDVKLFIEKLKSDLPEVFSSETPEEEKPQGADSSCDQAWGLVCPALLFTQLSTGTCPQSNTGPRLPLAYKGNLKCQAGQLRPLRTWAWLTLQPPSDPIQQ